MVGNMENSQHIWGKRKNLK